MNLPFNLPFTTEQYLSFIRHMLTLGGGVLIAKGITSQEVLNQVIGAIMTLLGFIWSLITHAPAVTLPPEEPVTTTVAPGVTETTSASGTTVEVAPPKQNT